MCRKTVQICNEIWDLGEGENEIVFQLNYNYCCKTLVAIMFIKSLSTSNRSNRSLFNLIYFMCYLNFNLPEM
jgi:hypothetical protein